MKIDRYKIESSLYELQGKVGELTHQTRDALQELQEKSAVVVEQTKTITRSVYKGTIQPGMQEFYRKTEQSAGEIYCKVSQNVTKLSEENHHFKKFMQKVETIVSPKK